MPERMPDAPEYSAPAIDKALDILELLADRTGGLGQLEIARAIDRSPGQIFRVLNRLEKRGYVYRDPQSGLYELSMRLFDLAHRHEPLRSLVAAALPAMRELATALGQSCNLGVLDAERVRIVAQVESPADFGFRVRVGAAFELGTTATGLVLAAFSDDPSRHGADADALAAIRERGHLVREDPVQPGITDVVFPVLRSDRPEAVAALTVPYVATSYSRPSLDEVRSRAADAATRITRALAL